MDCCVTPLLCWPADFFLKEAIWNRGVNCWAVSSDATTLRRSLVFWPRPAAVDSLHYSTVHTKKRNHGRGAGGRGCDAIADKQTKKCYAAHFGHLRCIKTVCWIYSILSVVEVVLHASVELCPPLMSTDWILYQPRTVQKSACPV